MRKTWSMKNAGSERFFRATVHDSHWRQIYCLTIRMWVPLRSRKGQTDSRDPLPSTTQKPKAKATVTYKKGPVVKPHHHHLSPRRNHLSLRSRGGKHHCTVTNNISGTVSAATNVASPATLLLVRCACAVAVCEKKRLGHLPSTSLIGVWPPRPIPPPLPSPPPLPPFPFPLCLRELGEHVHVAGIPRVGVVLSSCAEHAGHAAHAGSHQGHAGG